MSDVPVKLVQDQLGSIGCSVSAMTSGNIWKLIAECVDSSASLYQIESPLDLAAVSDTALALSADGNTFCFASSSTIEINIWCYNANALANLTIPLGGSPGQAQSFSGTSSGASFTWPTIPIDLILSDDGGFLIVAYRDPTSGLVLRHLAPKAGLSLSTWLTITSAILADGIPSFIELIASHSTPLRVAMAVGVRLIDVASTFAHAFVIEFQTSPLSLLEYRFDSTVYISSLPPQVFDIEIEYTQASTLCLGVVMNIGAT